MESGFQAQSLPSDFRAELVLSDLPAQTFSGWFLSQVSLTGSFELGRMAQISLMSWVHLLLCIPLSG